MALLDFLKKKNKKEKRAPETGAARKAATGTASAESGGSQEEKKPEMKEKMPASLRAAASLISPHVTEKSTRASEGGVYTFKVAKNANKPEIKKAVRELYGVRVDAVHIIHIPSKRRFSRGRVGMEKGYKKALVTLAKGEKIELV